MEKKVFFNSIFEKLIVGNQVWKLVPSISLKTLTAEYSDITEIYFTNKESTNWSTIAQQSNQEPTFIVGKYLTKYYYIEDEYTEETRYFFGVAQKIDFDNIESTTCITISDSSFEPLLIKGDYKVIGNLFDLAKESTFDFQNILDNLE